MLPIHFLKRPAVLALLAVAGSFLTPSAAHAVPSFARQTGMNCIICHTEFPMLTEFGRQFKLGGYTLSTGQSELPPLAVMLQPSFTHTNKGQDGGAAPGFSRNNNFALDQASVFYNGRLFGPYAQSLFGETAGNFLNKFGTFIQTTYDGVGKAWAWDNAEIRYADNATVVGQTLAYGVYLNNNPTMQDLWNTTPAWGFPFSGSALAPTPGAATMIDGAFGQQVLGLGAYAMIANHVYLDVGGYRTLSTGFQKAMGVDPEGEAQIAGIAPYWRAAYTKAFGNSNFELGMFGMSGSTYPGRDTSAGKDHFTDWGFDSEYQTSVGKNDFTTLLSWIYETDRLGASKTLGGASNGSDHLWTLRGAVNYLYDKTYGGAVGYFLTDGTHDTALHSESANGSPLSDGLVFQLNYIPFNKNGGPSFWPKSNLKLSLQYVLYNRFDGSSAHASDNNTLYLQAWFVF
jgi:hypothetical protein